MPCLYIGNTMLSSISLIPFEPFWLFQAGNNVIALHPSQPYRYGPATVSKNLQDLWCQVEFYDEEVADIPREEMYFITPECHAEVKEAILVGEDRWVGHAAVTRNDNDGVYYLGKRTSFFRT